MTGAHGGTPFPEVSPEQISKGKKLLAMYCLPCHGEKGDGKGAVAVALDPKPRNFLESTFKNGEKPEQILDTITHGVPGSAMTTFKVVSVEDRQAIVHYILSLKNGSK